ncbi:general transcription factor IIE subunit 1-like [Amphiura filiformis]|uniref:general transcription factor IIE subunit 1-like n=1 Tax=Amphiura filiformis TaxID=82378 RepID=UPI003B2184EF
MSTAPVIAPEPGVLTEVPDELKRLAKYIMRGFYSVEHALIIDILTRSPIVREDDMAVLLKFDKKQLRILLNKLKCEKLVKQTMRMETQADGRTNRQYYYFINYKVFVNVVKYKLDKMRQKTESKERDSTCKALFKCPQCLREYNEYDAGELMDPMTGLMHCILCGAEVHEDETAVPKKDAYTQMANFNEQLKIIFDLLKQVEHVKLSQSLLEPSPLLAGEKRTAGGTQKQAGPHTHWSGDSTRNMGDIYNQQVTINVGDEVTAQKSDVPAKERPIWLTDSTVEGAITEPMEAKSGGSGGPTSPTQAASKKTNEEIMRALLAHESKTGAVQPVIPDDNKSDESDASASEDEFPSTSTMPVTNDSTMQMDSGDEDDEEEEEEVMVMVGGKLVPFQDVTDEQVAQMSHAEKEEYIKLGQEAYSAMYD